MTRHVCFFNGVSTAAALWYYALHHRTQAELDDWDGQFGAVCPYNALSELSNEEEIVFKNAVVIPNHLELAIRKVKAEAQKHRNWQKRKKSAVGWWWRGFFSYDTQNEQ
jgi:hypothetical protein